MLALARRLPRSWRPSGICRVQTPLPLRGQRRVQTGFPILRSSSQSRTGTLNGSRLHRVVRRTRDEPTYRGAFRTKWREGGAWLQLRLQEREYWNRGRVSRPGFFTASTCDVRKMPALSSRPSKKFSRLPCFAGAAALAVGSVGNKGYMIPHWAAWNCPDFESVPEPFSNVRLPACLSPRSPVSARAR